MWGKSVHVGCACVWEEDIIFIAEGGLKMMSLCSWCVAMGRVNVRAWPWEGCECEGVAMGRV